MKAIFYILNSAELERILGFVCELVEKHYHINKTLIIYVDEEAQAKTLDLLLWTFKDTSFIPHALITQQEVNYPVRISYGTHPIPAADIVLNISASPPTLPQKAKEIWEVVPALTTAQQAARDRYRDYREQGYELETQKITTTLKAN